MCNCGKRAGVNGTTYKITMADGSTTTRNTEVAAKILVGRNPGARYEKVTAGS